MNMKLIMNLHFEWFDKTHNDSNKCINKNRTNRSEGTSC